MQKLIIQPNQKLVVGPGIVLYLQIYIVIANRSPAAERLCSVAIGKYIILCLHRSVTVRCMQRHPVNKI